MAKKKLNSGDLVVLKTSRMIVYKLIRLTKDGMNALCLNFRGEQKTISIFNLEKFSHIN